MSLCPFKAELHLQKIATGHHVKDQSHSQLTSITALPKSFSKVTLICIQNNHGTRERWKTRKKRFSERNSHALRLTHFLNQDKGFLKFAQRPYSDTSFLRVEINSLLLPTQLSERMRTHTKTARMIYRKHYPSLRNRSHSWRLGTKGQF